jgi:hypothetical protein
MERLNILWTTDNKDTFFNMISMYAVNSLKRGWWQQVNLIIWGASARLSGNDPQIQGELMEMIAQGVTVEACRDCADRFGVTDTLTKLGVDVRYMGEPLTHYLKNGETVLTL